MATTQNPQIKIALVTLIEQAINAGTDVERGYRFDVPIHNGLTNESSEWEIVVTRKPKS